MQESLRFQKQGSPVMGKVGAADLYRPAPLALSLAFPNHSPMQGAHEERSQDNCPEAERGVGLTSSLISLQISRAICCSDHR